MKMLRVIVLLLAGFIVSGSARADDQAAGVKKHQAVGIVKKVDAKKGQVTIAHEEVKSLKWPGMTMPFRVKDKALLSKFTVGKKVEFELMQEGPDYVIVGVK